MKKFISIILAICLVVPVMQIGAFAAGNEIVSVAINNISVIEGTHGYKDENGYYYNDIYPSFTVELKDGRKLSSQRYGIEIDGVWHSLFLNIPNQTEARWTPGNTYRVTGSISGVSDTFDVTIIENPVERVEIEDISLIENTEGYFQGAYFLYFPFPNYKVILKNGTVLKSFDNCVDFNGELYSMNVESDQSEENPWLAGNTYNVTGSVLGASAPFSVSITETPVESVVAEKVQFIKGMTFFDESIISGMDIRLKNGEKLEVSEKARPMVFYNDRNYPVSLIYDYEEIQSWECGNTYNITASVLGKNVPVEVEVTENPYSEFEVYGDHEMNLKLIKPSGEYDIAKAYNFIIYTGDNNGSAGGKLYTDKGIFEMDYGPVSDDDKETLKMNLGGLTSGDFKKPSWLSLCEFVSFNTQFLMCCYNETPSSNSLKKFDVNNYNTGALIRLAYYMSDIGGVPEMDENGESVVRVDRNTILDAIRKYFDIENVDFTKSYNYDASTPDIITIPFGGEYGTGELFPSFSYENNLWNVTVGDLEMTLTEDLKIKNFKITDNSILYGDVSDDGKVNIGDAMQLFSFVAGKPAILKNSSAADVNQDGKVNIGDAMKLFSFVAGKIPSL